MKLTGSNWFTGVGLLTVAFLKLCFLGYSLYQLSNFSPKSSHLLAGKHKPGCQHSGDQAMEEGWASKYSDCKRSYYPLYQARSEGMN